MEFKCSFYFSTNVYDCQISEANIIDKNDEIKEFKGNHEAGKSHNDVKGVCFHQTNLNYFPQGLQKHFPNLTRLMIFGGDIKEIAKNDLKGLQGLVRLDITNCKLTSLPDDLFTEMPNLRTVSFHSNKIEFASSELLKPLLGRENVEVNLWKNKKIDALYWPGSPDSLESLEELMKLIDEKCIKPIVIPDPADFNPKLKEMWLSGKFSDLMIIAGEKKFKVHKTILEMKNEIFAKIFDDHSEAAEIKIPDFSADSVEALLIFIYTNEITRYGNAEENFEIANKFKVDAMKSFFEKIICDELDDDNAWETFLFAHRVASQQLKEKAYQQIVSKIPEKVPDEFLEDPEILRKLIDARRVVEEILQNRRN